MFILLNIIIISILPNQVALIVYDLGIWVSN